MSLQRWVVAAAREAVVALITKFHPLGGSGPCVCHGGEWRALAAFDALRGDK